MDCFFLPVVFGCSTKISPEGDQTPRICPRCHNAAVVSAKSRDWFELCCIPVIPFSSKHVWLCTICQWQVPVGQGWEPPLVTSPPTQPGGYYPQQPGMQASFPPQNYQGGPMYQGPPQGQYQGQYQPQYQGQQYPPPK